VELVSLDLSLGGYTDTTGSVFTSLLLNRVRQLPDVQDATIASTSQVSDGMRSVSLTVTGAQANLQSAPFAEWAVAEPGYFATMRVPLVDGRDFRVADRSGTQSVAIVSESTARRLWPGERVIGKSLLLQEGRPGRSSPTPSAKQMLEVVGVARDLKYRDLGANAQRLVVYTPLQQTYSAKVTLVARTLPAQSALREIRALLASINPNLPIVTTRTLEEMTSLTLAPQRVAASVAGSLGIVGLLLAAIGVYGVTAYDVARRTREVGIRLALGASRGQVVDMVLRQGMSLVFVGSVIGLMLAVGVSRVLVGLLSGISPLDPLTFAGAAVIFAAVGLAACFVPALRAARIEAMEALRYE
jgi:putative ABC transport system permease protein